MRRHKRQSGLTLIEIIVATSIVVLLASIALVAAVRITSKAKEEHCYGIMEILNNALRQYRDYGYECRLNIRSTAELDFYRSLKFPVDCTGFNAAQVENEITNFMNLPGGATIIPAGKHRITESGCTVMYFFLSRIPQCRQTLDEIDTKFLKNDHNEDEDYLFIEIAAGTSTPREYPWTRILDPWGRVLRYDYYDQSQGNYNTRKETIRNFPLITSAGSDGIFDTSDDITNRKKTKPQ